MRDSDFRWIIQKTLLGKDSLNKLTEAVEQNDAAIELIDVIPFSYDIEYEPPDDKFPVIYGTSTFILGSYKHPYLKKGVFYNPEAFRMSVYLQHWNNHMLNSDAAFIEVGRLINQRLLIDASVFIRPDDDSKSFGGFVCSYEEILDRLSCLDSSNPYLNDKTMLLLASVKDIDREWRCFVVQGRVISSYRYRIHGETVIDSTDVPESMIAFVEEMCRGFTPHDIFVMDVALYQGRYKVIECNCINGSGIYQQDWSVIVRALQEFIIASNKV